MIGLLGILRPDDLNGNGCRNQDWILDQLGFGRGLVGDQPSVVDGSVEL